MQPASRIEDRRILGNEIVGFIKVVTVEVAITTGNTKGRSRS